MTQIAVPTGADVLAFLGWPSDAELLAQADVHAATIVQAALAYTRRRGFTELTAGTGNWTCEPDISAAIASACARSLNNPTQAVRQEVGGWSEVGGSFASWSLPEHLILRGYRKTAA